MADIVNLRRFRKAKARTDKAEAAERNRQQHGLTKEAKKDAKRLQDEAKRLLDGHLLGNETDEDES